MFDKLIESEREYAELQIKKCDNCMGIDNCFQELKGQIPIQILDELSGKWILGKTKCSKARGNYNNSIIKQDKYKSCNVNNLQDIINHVKEYRNLYLYGKVGHGKTHILYYLANKLNLNGKHVYIDLMSNINRKVKSEFNRKLEYDEKSFVTKLQEIDYLFIDDLGNELKTEYNILEVLFPIIDYRYVNNKPTFISSNYSINNLFAIYSTTINGKNQLTNDLSSQQIAPIISRLKTFGEIEIKGKNYRVR